MSVSSILNIAKNAVYAFQTSLQVTGHNVANVSTKGYSKKEAVLTEATPIPTSIGLLGDGVRVKGIIRYYDKYLEDMIAGKRTSLEEARVKQTYLSRIESLINEDSSGLSQALTDFFNSFHEMSLDPLSLAARTQVLLKGESLAGKIRYLYENLKDLQAEIDRNVGLEVEDATRILKSIAELNVKIFEGGLSGSEAGDYMDQRTELLKELSGKLKVQAFEDSEGRLTILTEKGRVLVDGGTYLPLVTVMDSETGYSKVGWKDLTGTVVDVTSEISKGKIKAFLELRDSALPDFVADLDLFGQGLVESVNAIHKSGYNMNGGTDVLFFVQPAGGYAKQIDVEACIKGDVRNIAHTSDPEEEGGNDICLSLANLGTSTIPALGSSFVDYLANLSSKIGGTLRAAKDTFTFEEETMGILEKQRESVSGVSIDEEMANLIKFQYAYQAAARLFTVADELLKSLLEAV